MTDWPDGKADQAAAAGSRARSRELGYSAAMNDMARMLDGQARMWRRAELLAAECGNWDAVGLMAQIAAETEGCAELADSVWELYEDHRPPQDPKSFIGWQWERTPPKHETGSFPAIP